MAIHSNPLDPRTVGMPAAKSGSTRRSEGAHDSSSKGAPYSASSRFGASTLALSTAQRCRPDGGRDDGW